MVIIEPGVILKTIFDGKPFTLPLKLAGRKKASYFYHVVFHIYST